MAAGSQKRPDGRQARWHQHNQDRRQRIIAAAIEELEAGEPGAEVHVQQIAERAGLSRSVVYRHFADRGDLDVAVQATVLDGLWHDLLPAVALEGTIPTIIERIVATYVGWAVAHPSLHRFAERPSLSAEGGPLEQGLARIADQVAELISHAVDVLDLEVDDDERAAIQPLVFGLVGMVFGAVRRWMAVPERTPGAPALVTLITESVWLVLSGHAAGFGLTLERHQNVDELLGLADGGEVARA